MNDANRLLIIVVVLGLTILALLTVVTYRVYENSIKLDTIIDYLYHG